MAASLGITLSLGLVAGVLAGLLGIGGGIVLIPGMVLLLQTGQHAAQGNSLAVMATLAFVGAIVHYRHGNIDLKMVLWIAPAAAAFGFLGAWAANLIDGMWLRRGFGAFLILVGLRMLLSTKAEE